MVASNSPWRYSFPLLINLCELSSDNKRGAGGSHSARPGPCTACELIALIEWEGLLASGFRSLPGLVWRGMNEAHFSSCWQLHQPTLLWDPLQGIHGPLLSRGSGPSLCDQPGVLTVLGWGFACMLSLAFWFEKCLGIIYILKMALEMC